MSPYPPDEFDRLLKATASPWFELPLRWELPRTVAEERKQDKLLAEALADLKALDAAIRGHKRIADWPPAAKALLAKVEAYKE